ncbi:52 kDa repressor of the inhibitor of the protein kinase-like [Drosophila ananassae]|uniref:52 kDa repressor of the inhibitor of the protein kinase-like n=1 Tax=Drosophila ananassae TaxID=7217 RepID=UPI001CFF5AF9|nr:52 kDa repressor of the inhibitor of the protein kinase-like [Drosophila ananassae]
MKELAPKEHVLEKLLIEAESIVNSRLLTHLPVTVDHEAPLPSNDLLKGAPDVSNLPKDDGQEFVRCATRKQWRIARMMRDRFWKDGEWKRGVVEEVFTGRDGVPRRAAVRTNDRAKTRPSSKLTVLDVVNAITSPGLTKNRSLFLQQEDCDLSQCVGYANDVHQQIKQMRVQATEKFSEIFILATEAAETIDAELTVPRRVGRQKNRDNYEGGVEDYYRRSIYIPFLDKYSEELESRFLEHRNILSRIQNIIPEKCADIDVSELHDTVQTLKEEWPNDIRRMAKYSPKNSKQKLSCGKENVQIFVQIIEALDVCDETFYPTVYRFLQIGATLPETVASSERSFSTLRRLKTYLRNKTGEQRLNGLALLNIHRDLEVTSDAILSIMAQKPRKIIIHE